MKHILRGLVIAAVSVTSAMAQNTIDVTSNITTNTTWTSDKIVNLKGFIFVEPGATLTIEPGTIIKGDSINKSTLIIERGAKIMAQGTPSKPIVFTSSSQKGERKRGDWGGLVILGKAPVNNVDPLTGDPKIEGFPGTIAEQIKYGGTDANDNSGVLSYVRLEFGGIAFSPDNEINGLTMGGVGKGTTIDHIQVSYSGDDSYEWFGGNVDAKNLISFRALDDDFDTDNGYSGNVQFGLVLRDPNVADKSGSNGFESDNDAKGTDNSPFTSPVFSNITSVGPLKTTGDMVNSYYKNGAHVRRNSRLSLFNSIIMGWPNALLVDGTKVESNIDNKDLVMQNNIIAGNKTNYKVATGSTYDPQPWFENAANSNRVLANVNDAMLENPFTLSNPDIRPKSGSPALTGAAFSHSKLSNSFFDKSATFLGAMGTSENWLASWTNFDPQNADYTQAVTSINENVSGVEVAKAYPNPAKETATIELFFTKTQQANISVYDLGGKLVNTVESKTFAFGNNNVNIDVRNLENGLYIVRIETESGNRNIRLSVIR